MRVRELMSQPVVSCSIGDTLERPAKLMWDRDCGAIPVIYDDGRIAGIVTDRDICMAALFHGRPLSEIPVAHAMSADVSTCRPGDDLAEAEHQMSARQVHRLPVVGMSGEPVGMLSVSDIAQIARRQGKQRPSGAPNGEFVETIAAITQPRAQGDRTENEPAPLMV